MGAMVYSVLWHSIEALIIRIGFWGPLYYKTLIRNPQNPILIIKASTLP